MAEFLRYVVRRLTESGRRRHKWALAVLVLLLPLAALGEPSGNEEKLKAAFVYKFAQFTSWPAEALEPQDRPIVFCVMGGGPLSDELKQTVLNRSVHDRSVRVESVAGPSSTASCHLLFVPSSQEADMHLLVARLAGRPVLTIGETSTFTKQGGVMALMREGRRLRFRANPGAAKRVGLRLSSQLIALATEVDEDEAPREGDQ